MCKVAVTITCVHNWRCCVAIANTKEVSSSAGHSVQAVHCQASTRLAFHAGAPKCSPSNFQFEWLLKRQTTCQRLAVTNQPVSTTNTVHSATRYTPASHKSMLLVKSHNWSEILPETLTVPQIVKKFAAILWKTDGSLPHSDESSTGQMVPFLIQLTSPYTHCSTLFSHLYLALRGGRFPSDLPTTSPLCNVRHVSH